MSKEFTIVDAPISNPPEDFTQNDVIKLDDLSLALVGGGQADVVF